MIRGIIRCFLDFNMNLFLFSLAFLCRFPLRKNRWWILLSGGILFAFGPTFYRSLAGHSLYSSPAFMLGWYSVSYLVFCGLLLVIYYHSFHISVKELLLILCSSYLIQNLIYNFYLVVRRSLPGVDATVMNGANAAGTLLVTVLIFWINRKQLIKFDIGKIRTAVVWVVCIGVILLVTVISQWTGVYVTDVQTGRTALSLYAGISAVLLLFILITVFSNSWLNHENELISELLKKGEKQYRISQDNVNYINEKVHDLKHQITAIKQIALQGDHSPEMRQKVEDLEKIAQVYDKTILTGNNVLDALLTEELQLCKRNSIQLSFVINGEDLDFLEPVDLYVLFGNAFDNAVESVLKIEDESKRIISIHAGKKDRLVRIEFENPYVGKIVFHDGVPSTNKQGENYHGFGIKSIRYIVQKYNGNLAISTENQMFKLSVLFPLKI